MFIFLFFFLSNPVTSVSYSFCDLFSLLDAPPIYEGNVATAINDNTRAVFIESLANPGGVVQDIEAIAKVAHDAGVPLIVDNTMATPMLCRPNDYGADIVVHSTTKFLNRHGNAIGGVIVDGGSFDWTKGGKFPTLTAPND